MKDVGGNRRMSMLDKVLIEPKAKQSNGSILSFNSGKN